MGTRQGTTKSPIHNCLVGSTTYWSLKQKIKLKDGASPHLHWIICLIVTTLLVEVDIKKISNILEIVFIKLINLTFAENVFQLH